MQENNKRHSYPPLQGEAEDEHTHKRSMELLRQEVTSGKPSGNATVKQLMSRTFLNRRDWITSSELPVKDILEEYKVLKKIPHVRLILAWNSLYLCTVLQIAHEMDMICNIEKSSSLFEDNWKKYVGIILKYSKTVQVKEIKAALEGLDNFDDDDDTGKLSSAACCYLYMLCTNQCKQEAVICTKKSSYSLRIFI